MFEDVTLKNVVNLAIVPVNFPSFLWKTSGSTTFLKGALWALFYFYKANATWRVLLASRRLKWKYFLHDLTKEYFGIMGFNPAKVL